MENSKDYIFNNSLFSQEPNIQPTLSPFLLDYFSSGKMKGLAFIQDPDGYWIEILSPNTMVSITS